MSFYKARLYSPTLGRFMQTDSIGYGDGPNWYAYVHNNPINRTDPTGTCDDGDVCLAEGLQQIEVQPVSIVSADDTSVSLTSTPDWENLQLTTDVPTVASDSTEVGELVVTGTRASSSFDLSGLTSVSFLSRPDPGFISKYIGLLLLHLLNINQDPPDKGKPPPAPYFDSQEVPKPYKPEDHTDDPVNHPIPIPNATPFPSQVPWWEF